MPSAGVSFLLSRGLTGILWALTDVPRRSADGIPTLDRYYNRAVPGSDAFTAQYEGATFKFASAEHRDAFIADPAKYAPQYGGFCAYCTAAGHKAVTNSEAFIIIDDKLYLNYSKIPGQVGEGHPRLYREGPIRTGRAFRNPTKSIKRHRLAQTRGDASHHAIVHVA